ncbi:MAG: hypothetical protein NTW54_00650 [Bacteroidetes bacterium]|nr:hypothetical protein [Bacteroidota bacterium]
MKYIFFGLVLTLIVSSSCKNDIKLNADYKEIAVVYGLLDRNDTVHYIRIQRAFQNTNATAQSISQKPDSLYFDSLEVKITDLTTAQVYTLTKEMSVVKDSGYFQNKVNVLYRFNDAITSAHRYRLTIRSVFSNNMASAETVVVGNPLQILLPPGDTFDILPNKIIYANFKSGVNARAYDIFYRFKYDEFDSITGNLSAQKYIDYFVQRSGLTSTLNGGEEINQKIESEDLIRFIGNAIPVQRGVKRVATFLDAFYAGAADDLNVYLDVSKPSIGIVQKKPEFSNISNGFGVFSSRSVFFKRHPVNTATQKTLREHVATKDQGWK